MLDSFFSALQPRKSLSSVCQNLPLDRRAEGGERFLVVRGVVDSVDPFVEWEYTENGPIRRCFGSAGLTLDPPNVH